MRVLSLAIAGAIAAPLSLHVPLKTASGASIKWSVAKQPVSFVINVQGSADIPGDASEDLAIRLGFQAWQDLAGSSIAFVEDTDPAQRARTDWQADDIHLVLFDETNSSGLFANAGIIAITPISFSPSTGAIVDADILFNGSGQTFSTSLAPAKMDIRSTATHEIGHLLGLDHSALGGATMAPFQTTQQFNGRTLSSDDIAGAEQVYPVGTKGKITGLVKRASNATVVRGANVWARSTADGRDAVGTVSRQDGTYTINGLAPGDYRITAAPIDGPITSPNFSSSSVGGPIETDFQATSIGPVTVVGTGTTAAPDLAVAAPAASAFNVTAPGVTQTIHQGQSKLFGVTGSGLAGATVAIPDSGTAFVITGTALAFNVTAAADAPLGMYDVFFTNVSGDVADYSGFLEVLPPIPGIGGVDPAASATAGGASFEVTGSAFASPFDVVLGDVAATGATLSAPGTIDATAPAHAAATVDVVVVTSGGEEARLPGGFEFVAATLPAVASVYPGVGSTAGGTAVTILGSGFDANATVAFDATPASSATVVSATRIDAVAPALAAGLHDVSVTNPAASGFPSVDASAYEAKAAPGPAFTKVDPDVVPFGGGSTISIQGTDFVDGATVRLFASPLDGSGGQSVAATFVSPTELTLVVPAGPLGETALLVENPDGQVAVAKGALTLAPFLVAGTKLQGSVATPGDVDTALYEAIAGTKLGLTLARLPKSIVQPAIRVVRDSDGTVLLATDPVDPAFDPLFATSKTTSATVKNFVLPQTEILRLEVLGLAGSTGGYKLTIKETLPASARSIKVPTKPPTVVGPGNASFPFVAKTGSTLKGKVTAKKPLQVEVATLDGPAGSILGAVAATLVPGLNNSSVTFKSTPLAKFGAYTLAIGPLAATTGTITGTVTIVAPKATTTFVEP